MSDKQLNNYIHNNEVMFCTYKEIKDCGHTEPCFTPVLKENMDKSNYNNNYCPPHQALVDTINRHRNLIATNYLKEKINLYFDAQEKITEETVQQFLRILNKGHF